MRTQYSTSVFLAFAVGVTLYSGIAFYSFGASLSFHLLPGDNLPIAIARVCCICLAIIAMWLIYISKPSEEVVANNIVAKVLQPWLPFLQAFYPVMYCLSVTMVLFKELNIGACEQPSTNLFYNFCDNLYGGGGITMRLQFDLMFFPIFAFAFLADTRIEAIVVAWLLCIGTLIG